MTRFRLTVSTEWEVDSSYYDTTDVAEMLAIDQANADDDPMGIPATGDKWKVVVEDITDRPNVPLTHAEIQQRLDAHPELIQRLSDGDTSAFEEIFVLAGAKIGTVTVRDVTAPTYAKGGVLPPGVVLTNITKKFLANRGPLVIKEDDFRVDL